MKTHHATCQTLSLLFFSFPVGGKEKGLGTRLVPYGVCLYWCLMVSAYSINYVEKNIKSTLLNHGFIDYVT